MWNKRQSQFLLIRISHGGFRRLIIPIPLFVLDLTLASFSDLVRLVNVFLPNLQLKLKRFGLGGDGTVRLSMETLLEVCFQLFKELRKHGRLRLVEVQADRVRVFIDLY